jgi:WhiB family redox-sensing transcriptional regulator
LLVPDPYDVSALMKVADVHGESPSPIDDGPEAQAARRRALEQALIGVRAARRRRKPEPAAIPAPPAPEPGASVFAEDSADDGSPALSTLPWIERAACRGADPGLFFGPDLLSADGRRERRAERRRRETQAKVFCADCPVRDLCAEHALSLPELHGVWGGMGETERLVLLDHMAPGDHREVREPGLRADPRPRAEDLPEKGVIR